MVFQCCIPPDANKKSGGHCCFPALALSLRPTSQFRPQIVLVIDSPPVSEVSTPLPPQPFHLREETKLPGWCYTVNGKVLHYFLMLSSPMISDPTVMPTTQRPAAVCTDQWISPQLPKFTAGRLWISGNHAHPNSNTNAERMSSSTPIALVRVIVSSYAGWYAAPLFFTQVQTSEVLPTYLFTYVSSDQIIVIVPKISVCEETDDGSRRQQ